MAIEAPNDVDVTALMRAGHPQIADGDAYILGLVDAWLRSHGRPPRVMNVGCGSGWIASKILERVEGAEVVANEIDEALAKQLEKRLAGTHARIFTEPFEAWREPADIILSWGSHHHLPESYMDHAKALLTDGGVFILGDEFCPEYCNADDRARLAAAERLRVIDGLLFTSAREVSEYARTKQAPAAALAMEHRRRHALWRWYRYVVDYAVARDCFDVAIYELRAAHDDLITGNGDEHKMSPAIVERDLQIRGYRMKSRKSLGPEGEPEHQSFIVYEYEAPGATQKS